MQLKLRGFKAVDRDVEIGGRVLIVGPNASGKSAIADAVRFFALGFVPHLGKRPQDSALLMPDQVRELSVELAVAGGNAKRTLSRREKGFELGASCSWLTNAKPTENAKAITGLFGKEEIDVAEVLDLRELLNETPNARAARLEGLVASGRRTAQEILVAVKRRIVQRLAEISDERMREVKDYKAVLPLVPEPCLAVLAESADPLEAKITAGGLAAALAWSKEEKNRAAEGLKRREAAAHELRLRAVEVPEPDPREIAALEKERSELDQKLGALAREIAGVEAAKGRRAAVQAAATSAEDHLGVCRESAARAPEWEKELVRVVEELQAYPKEPQRPEYPKNEAAIELLNEAKAASEKARGIKTEPIGGVDDLAAAVTDLEVELSEVGTSVGPRILEIAAEIEGATPPKLKKIAGSIKKLRELVKEAFPASREKEAVEAELSDARAGLEAAEKAQNEAKARNAKADEDVRKLLALAQEKADKARSLTRKAQDEAEKAVRDWEGIHQKWVDQRVGLMTMRESLSNAIQKARGGVQAAEARLEEARKALEAQGPAPDAPGDVQPLADRKAAIEIKIRTLNAAAAVHVEIQRGLDAIAGAKAERDVFAAIEWAVNGERLAELAGSGGRFLELVAEFLKAGGREEKPFIHPGAMMGWTTPLHDVNVQAMSGGEWALFTAAVACAATMLRPSKLKILLVEAGEMDQTTLLSLMKGIAAVGDQLTSAIVTTWKEPDILPEAVGFRLIKTTAEPLSVPQQG